MPWRTAKQKWLEPVFKTAASYPSASEAQREAANITERKNHMPPYMVSKNLSVCLSDLKTLTPIISGLAEQIGRKKIIYDFFAGNNYHDLPHSQRGMKFAHKLHLYLIVIS